MELVLFLGKVIMISLSGVMAPGPVTAVVIASGARNRYAGILMALGHGIVEFPLMIVIVLGAGTLVVDLVDRKTETVVWRAVGSEAVKGPEKKLLPKIDRMVRAMFREYPAASP